MGLFLDGPLPLEAVNTFVQAVPLPSNNKLTQSFPTKTFLFDEIDFATITQTNRVAKFRNFDGGFWVAPRDTGSEKRVKMLPLGGKLETGEYERRQQEFAKMGGTIQSVLVDAIYNDLENLTRYAQNRIEVAWGDVLSDGVLTINENGVQQQVDFGVPSGQKVAPATVWSNKTSSTPLTDVLAWCDAYQILNGVMPGRIVTSLQVARNLMQNTQLINAIKGAQTGVTMVSLEEISNLFASYGLPAISMDSVYNSNFDIDGTTTPALPQAAFLLLPEDLSTLGFTAWGTPTTVMELNAANVQVETAPGLVGMIVREENPPFVKSCYVDGVALPVIADPRKITIATVL